jgi:hypothetical protein
MRLSQSGCLLSQSRSSITHTSIPDRFPKVNLADESAILGSALIDSGNLLSGLKESSAPLDADYLFLTPRKK